MTTFSYRGQHAQTTTGTKPVFAFIPSRNETENGVTAGDLLLLKLGQLYS